MEMVLKVAVTLTTLLSSRPHPQAHSHWFPVLALSRHRIPFPEGPAGEVSMACGGWLWFGTWDPYVRGAPGGPRPAFVSGTQAPDCRK